MTAHGVTAFQPKKKLTGQAISPPVGSTAGPTGQSQPFLTAPQSSTAAPTVQPFPAPQPQVDGDTFAPRPPGAPPGPTAPGIPGPGTPIQPPGEIIPDPVFTPGTPGFDEQTGTPGPTAPGIPQPGTDLGPDIIPGAPGTVGPGGEITPPPFVPDPNLPQPGTPEFQQEIAGYLDEWNNMGGSSSGISFEQFLASKGVGPEGRIEPVPLPGDEPGGPDIITPPGGPPEVPPPGEDEDEGNRTPAEIIGDFLNTPTAFEGVSDQIRSAMQALLQENTNINTASRGVGFSTIQSGQLARGFVGIEASISTQLAQAKDKQLSKAVDIALDFMREAQNADEFLSDLQFRLLELGVLSDEQIQAIVNDMRRRI